MAKLELEFWDGPVNRREAVFPSTSESLQKALTALDGDKIDTLWINRGGDGLLCIGGGPDIFVASVFPLDGSSSHAEIRSAIDGDIELQVGGQTGVYQRKMLLPIETAVHVSRLFLETGKLDETVLWIVDSPPEP